METIRMVRFREGLKRLGDIHPATAYRRQKTDPNFPRIVKPLGTGSKPSAFIEAELNAFLAKAPAELAPSPRRSPRKA
jgi:predicted DNA-binding transcriptional regulator AlpA